MTQVLLFHGRVPGFTTGIVGVGVFFVLSGFLITHLIMAEIGTTGQFRLRRFYVRRIRRLLPAYALTLAFCICAAFIIADWTTLRGALASLLYVSNWMLIKDPEKGLGMLHHTWTLSIEEQFYMVWPALLLCISFRPKRALRLAVLVACVMISIIILAMLISLRSETSIQRENLLATLSGYLMLISGSFLALLYHRFGLASVTLPTIPGMVYEGGALAALCALAVVSSFGPGYLAQPVSWMLILAASSVLILASLHSTGVFRWCLTRPVLVGIGVISYGLYLWHFPMFYLVDSFLGLDGYFTVILAASLSLGIAIASYLFVEMSFRKGGFQRWPSWLTRQTLG